MNNVDIGKYKNLPLHSLVQFVRGKWGLWQTALNKNSILYNRSADCSILTLVKGNATFFAVDEHCGY